MQKIIGVRRNGDKNLYYFLPDDDTAVGDKVVVQFDDFQTVVTVERISNEADDTKAYELERIKRKATERDLKQFAELSAKAKEILPQVKKKSLELGLMMKFVSAEYSLDNSKILIVFSSEERVDFRQLLKELAGILKVRIELKQIGQRDEVKVCGGVGPCGQPCCCARFLKDFEHVTVKMAKVQGLSLSPTKINGVCGRLMCCLGYESETYEQILATMPKVGSEVVCPNGRGTASYNDILRERVSVRRQEGDTFVVEDFDLEDIIFGDKLKEYNAHPERFTFKKKENKLAENQEKRDEKTSENKFEGSREQKTFADGHSSEKSDEQKKHSDGNQKNYGKFHSKNKFNKNNTQNQSGNESKYGITFESAEVAQAEHEAEQRNMANKKPENSQPANEGTKPFKKSYNGKKNHHRFGPKK